MEYDDVRMTLANADKALDDHFDDSRDPWTGYGFVGWCVLAAGIMIADAIRERSKR